MSVPSSEQLSCADQNGTSSTNKRKRRPAGTPEPPDAQAAAQGAVEAAEAGDAGGAEARVRLPRAIVLAPRPLPRAGRPGRHQEALPQEAQQPQAMGLPPLLQGLRRPVRLQGPSQDLVESFIEHQDACNMGRVRPDHPSQPLQQPAACLSRTASSPSPSSETNFSTGPAWPAPPSAGVVIPKPTTEPTFFNKTTTNPPADHQKLYPNLDLQLSTAMTPAPNDVVIRDETHSTQLQLSIGSSTEVVSEKNESNRIHNNNNNNNASPKESSNSSEKAVEVQVQEEAREHMRIAMAEKAYAEEARKEAKRQMEAAEQEFANAKRIRQQAQAELDKAYALKEQAIKQINSTMLHITCHACKQQFQLQQAPKLVTEAATAQVILHSNSNNNNNNHPKQNH
ncbi:zinc finger protein SHOOT GRAVITROPISM 5-like [Senna tora]|uniref:Zinc finger protein SHOOT GRAVITROPISM 5-like n=1 Tax=Senna tora TaxID=362788 RepID=A0A834WJY3_9FABA|nr:zinc finger protein SHOOT GRAVITROPISM 5-like [Senna tora]